MAASRAEAIARRLLAVPPGERAGELRAMLGELSRAEAEALLHDWALWGREDQQEPGGDWVEWLVQAGRGAGKTRTGAEWIRRRVDEGARRIAFVARTAADARDTMVEGESGILSVFPRFQRPRYEPSKRRVTFHTGAIATLFSSKEPDLLRGPQHDTAWGDEVASWFHATETLDNLMFGLRIGRRPRLILTTTPRPKLVIRRLVASPTCHVTRGSLYDNLAHLAPAFVAKIVSKYEGTRIGRQEVHGELLEDVPGALWSRAGLEDRRREAPALQMLERIVVAVDPPGSSDDDDDEDFDDEHGSGTEAGIVVAGRGVDANGYVLDDRSKRASPAEWALEAIAAFHAWRADLIVVEDNYGGDMVEHTIAVHDPTVPIGRVHAKRGKYLRAEPVAAMFEPAKARPPMCFLGGSFPELEDQMCLPPWALVAAERGLVPIAELVAGERVWTRRGLAPIEWVGPTGWAYGLREIVHEGGRLWATEDHPILTARGFVPAGDVRSTDRLLVEHRWASTARRWRGEVAGGTGWLPGTTGTPEASFCTVRSTVPITVTSLVAGMSTIATMIPATIGSRTWSRVRPLSTTASILRAGGTRSMIPLRAVACVVPSGNAASRARAPAPSAVTGSPRPGCGPRSARGGAGADRMSVTAMQVYDLKVTDGYSPEFFADGVLVHNCTWVQGEGESPDRLDAMVHALTELLLEPAGEEAPRVVEYEDRVRISPH